MSDDLRTRIGRVLQRLYGPSLGAALEWDSEPKRTRQMYLADADAVIRELPELRRIAHVRDVCVASLNRDRVPGEALSDRAWLADTVLNVLNGAVDDQ